MDIFESVSPIPEDDDDDDDDEEEEEDAIKDNAEGTAKDACHSSDDQRDSRRSSPKRSPVRRDSRSRRRRSPSYSSSSYCSSCSPRRRRSPSPVDSHRYSSRRRNVDDARTEDDGRRNRFDPHEGTRDRPRRRRRPSSREMHRRDTTELDLELPRDPSVERARSATSLLRGIDDIASDIAAARLRVGGALSRRELADRLAEDSLFVRANGARREMLDYYQDIPTHVFQALITYHLQRKSRVRESQESTRPGTITRLMEHSS